MLLFSFHYVIFAWNYRQINSDNNMGDKYQIPYTNACIRAFAKRFNLSVKVAFDYLYAFKGIDFLVEFYEIEHLQSIDDAVDDLIVCCANNGGTLR